jgi:hypothetical protein
MQHGILTIDRAVRALMFELDGDQYRSVVVWTEVRPYGVRVADPEKSWLTIREGDELIVNGRLEKVSRILLYSVHPSDQCDRAVTCAADWLADE